MSVVADDGRLFEVGPALEARSERGPVDKTFRRYDPHVVWGAAVDR